MASLHRSPGSPFWFCAFTHADGARAFKSTKKRRRKEAEEIARGWQRAIDLARKEELSEPELNRLKSETLRDGRVVLPKNRAFVEQVFAEIFERATGGQVNFSTTAEFFKDWIDSKEQSTAKGTWRRYRDIINGFLAVSDRKAKLSLSALTPADILSFRDQQLRDGKSNKTANLATKTLRIALNSARRHGVIFSNPAEAVEMLPENSVSRETFTTEQVKAMLGVADIEWQGMILLGACHGLRLGDASRLTWSNVDMERRSIRFVPKKDGKRGSPKGLEVPMHPDVEEYLRSLPIKSDNPNAPLFPTLSKKKLNGQHGLSNYFTDVLMPKAGIFREAAVEKVKGKGRRVFSLGFHALRHTAVSIMANAGVTKERRMKLSGHKSNVHERYTHHELETLRQDVERIPSFQRP